MILRRFFIETIVFTFFLIGFQSCQDLDIPPMNIIQDKDVFANEDGINAYMARMYSEMPIEDFRFSYTRMFNMFWLVQPPSAYTGEAISWGVDHAESETVGYWADAYKLIRETNYFIQTLPNFSNKYTQEQVNHLLGEARFIRGFTYFALAKRYGGVPIIDKVLNYPEISIDETRLPRNSEEETWDFISSDFDYAIQNMKTTSATGRANKYVAAAMKSRAMLYAGSIAKYNITTLIDNTTNTRLCGISESKANDYFKQSFDATKILENVYSLYTVNWSPGNKEAQYQNYVNLFLDANSSENIWVKSYRYPESVHGFDSYNVPLQLKGPNGYSSLVCPTLDFVELFDGISKDSNGHLQILDANNKYLFYDKTMSLFANAEPRLRATVILPGDVFKGEIIEVRRGIYTGSVTSGIAPLLAQSTDNYPTKNLLTSSDKNWQEPYTLPDGTTMKPIGASGTFNNSYSSNGVSGFFIRKYLNPLMPTAETLENHSAQTWIEMRYAEVLLNRAEAAYELYSAGINSGVDYLQDATDCINSIRLRAGANLLTTKADLNSINIVRNERRKELAFENKTYWDLKRWRIIADEQNSRFYRILNPFYAAKAGKYFFDIRSDERKSRYTFDYRWYYQQIPGNAINTNPNIKQNPGY